jgi:hypothetical protein
MGRRLVPLVVAASLAAASGTALAQARIVLDQATIEPSPFYGLARVRLFVSAVDQFSGQVVPIDGPKAWQLEVSGTDRRDPYFVTTYDGGQYLTAIAIVVETTAEYAPDLPTIAAVLDQELLGKLPSLTTTAAIIGYAEKPTATGKFGTTKAAATRLGTLTAATDPTEPSMLEAVDRAVSALKKYKTDPEGQPVRKIVIVVSDGRDKSEERTKVTALGKRAGKDAIRIHSLAYSPSDTRRPLLALGELSKRSLGTFRWVQKIGTTSTEQSFREQVKTLLAEIDDQYVLTYYLPVEDIAGKKLQLTADQRGKQLQSLSIKAPVEATCGGVACTGDGYCISAKCIKRGSGGGRGILGWILLVGGMAVGAIVVLGLIGFALQKRKEKIMRRYALAAAAGLASSPPPGVAPHVPGSQPPAPGPTHGDGRIQGVPLPGYQSQPAARHAPGSQPPAPVERVQAIRGIGEGQTTASQPPAGVAQPMLYVVGGPRAGERLVLRHGFVIGKDKRCDLTIDDGYTSAQHAMILMDARGNCAVQDRGSTNGTFVNGVRVAEPVALYHGVTIRIGSTDLKFLAQ